MLLSTSFIRLVMKKKHYWIEVLHLPFGFHCISLTILTSDCVRVSKIPSVLIMRPTSSSSVLPGKNHISRRLCYALKSAFLVLLLGLINQDFRS